MTDETVDYTRQPPPTPKFLSPVTSEGNIVGDTRVTMWVFYMLMPGSPAMKLQYMSQDIATEARFSIMEADNMHDVTSMELFNAISQAFEILAKPA